MTKREQLKDNIKLAKQAKQIAHGKRADAIKNLRGARQDYDKAAETLVDAQAALVAFDNGETLDKPAL